MLDTTSSQQDHLEQILENSPDGVFTIRPDLTIKYVNPTFCQIVDYEAQELLGTEITRYLGDLKILDACMMDISRQGFCNDQETIFIRKDGSRVHISKNVRAIYDDQGGIAEILVSIRDMTELHALNKSLASTVEELTNTQKQLVEAEKMASLGALVAGVAHEINTPLGISITSASSVEMELKELSGKFRNDLLKKSELERFIERAEQACQILNSNLNRAGELVKSFKQVAVDQNTEKFRRINLKDYIDEILLSIGPTFNDSAVELESHCDESIELDTHPGAIYQIISNLVFNARLHAYDEGDSGKICINIWQQDGRVMLDFSDDGKGISEENLNDVFTPFFTTRRDQGGSGLGLSIVYNLVSGTLNGSISVESSVEKGTKFHISFPVDPAEPVQ